MSEPKYHDLPYMDLARDVLDHGVRKENRTGMDTFAVFSRQMRFDLSDGSIPLLTTKKMHARSVIYELLWYLRGDTNIKYLNDNGVRIWNEWADENGELGPVYGAQWRKWPVVRGTRTVEEDGVRVTEPVVKHVDQIFELIDKLRRNPMDRRLIVSAWNVGYLDAMALPPCHYTFQFYTRPLARKERIGIDMQRNGNVHLDATDEILDNRGIPKYELSLMLNQRSCDVGLGVPFNIVQYSMLLHMVAQVVDMVPGEFIWNGGDVHVYENHWDALNEQLMREPYKSPKLQLNTEVHEINDFKFEDFEIVGYEHHPLLKMEVSV